MSRLISELLLWRCEMDKQLSKSQRAFNHLEIVGNISSWEAIQLFNSTKLGDIIFKLRKAGYFIVSLDEKSTTDCQYVRYFYPSVMNQKDVEELYRNLSRQYDLHPASGERVRMGEQLAELKRDFIDQPRHPKYQSRPSSI